MSICWEEVRLGDIISIKSEKYTPNKNEVKKCIELEHLEQNTGILLEYTNSNLQKSTKNVFKKGQVLFGKLRPYLKKYYLAEFDGVCSSEIWVMSGNNVLNNFLFYLVQSDDFMNAANISCGTKMPRADWKYMQEITIKLPPLKEQEKITEILSSCDEHIKNLKNLKSELEKEKLHLMNELLIGKTRFANFTTPWQEVKFGDILTFASCSSKSKFICDDGKYFIVDMGSVTQDGVLNTSKRTNLEEDFLKIDDLVMPKDDIGKGLIIGKVAIIKEDNKYICGDHIYKINTTENPNFIRFLINSCEVNKEIKRVVKGTAQLGLSKKDIEKIKIKLPSLEEQKKIGEVLSACDERLECLNELITAQTTLKSHLLTELLSGNIRVNI